MIREQMLAEKMGLRLVSATMYVQCPGKIENKDLLGGITVRESRENTTWSRWIYLESDRNQCCVFKFCIDNHRPSVLTSSTQYNITFHLTEYCDNFSAPWQLWAQFAHIVAPASGNG